jgi:hypothetical protein
LIFDLATLPDWPLLLDMPGMCKLTTLPGRNVERAVAAGRLPEAREFLPGVWRWHLDEVRARLAELYQLEGKDGRLEASRRVAEDALVPSRPKPTSAPYVAAVKSRGRLHLYCRREDKRLQLPDLVYGAEFLSKYATTRGSSPKLGTQ